MVKPKKKLGQHFLTDENIAQKIVNALDYETADAILEIGPGTGVLTKWLKEKKTPYYLVEIDTESVEYLQATYPSLGKKLIEDDFLEMDLRQISQESFHIIGNFPYNISSQIFFKILDVVENVPQVVCMIQYEVAQRLASQPNCKQYGILSVLLQAYYNIELLFKVPPNVFNPPPKVASGVIRLTRKENYESVIDCNKKLFKTIVKTAFNQRRKMLSNSLKSVEGIKNVDAATLKKRPEQTAISNEDKAAVVELVQDLHPADIAEVFDDLNIDEAKYVFLLLDDDIAADVLTELEDDDLLRFIEVLPPQSIADKFISKMDSDDAADVLRQMSNEQREAVLTKITDREFLTAIVDLLKYDEDTAGGLMAKEIVIVKDNFTVLQCLQELTRQAENVDEIHYVYVVNNAGVLKGVLSLKDIILNRTSKSIENIYEKDVISVKASMPDNEVANLMSKYDLIALPVVDNLGRLVGRITVDDVIDIAREEADKDYQMMSGLAEEVEFSDNLTRQVRARLPWLIIGLIGGILGAVVIGTYEEELAINPTMAFFLPLIAAMGGNVGVQSSAIIVQGLANNSLGVKKISSRLLRELSGAIIMGTVCSLLLFGFNYFNGNSQALTFAASTALLTVMVFASIFGTLIPLLLDKAKIDPALATGPFITTLNDIIGLFCYLYIGKLFFEYFMV